MNWQVEYATYNGQIISFAIYDADRPNDRRPIVESGNGWSHEENLRHAEIILNAAEIPNTRRQTRALANKIKELLAALKLSREILGSVIEIDYPNFSETLDLIDFVIADTEKHEAFHDTPAQCEPEP